MAKGFLLNSYSKKNVAGLYPWIIVTGPYEGSTVTATDGVTTIVSSESNGEYSMMIPNYGSWTVTVTLGDDTQFQRVVVDEVKKYFITDLRTISTTLADNSWDMIASVAEAGKGADYWSVGDTIPVYIADNDDGSTNSYQFRIIGFNHDTKSDGSGTNGITFEMVNCLKDEYYMISSGSTYPGWGKTDLRDTLNSTIFNQLNTDKNGNLCSLIKNVDKGYKWHNTSGPDYSGISSDKLFILSLTEVSIDDSDDYDYDKKYSFYSSGNRTLKKKISDTTTDYANWWLRTKNGGQCNYITSAGSSGAIYPKNKGNVSFAFVI